MAHMFICKTTWLATEKPRWTYSSTELKNRDEHTYEPITYKLNRTTNNWSSVPCWWFKYCTQSSQSVFSLMSTKYTTKLILIISTHTFIFDPLLNIGVIIKNVISNDIIHKMVHSIDSIKQLFCTRWLLKTPHNTQRHTTNRIKNNQPWRVAKFTSHLDSRNRTVLKLIS